jgi:hypothetical protein
MAKPIVRVLFRIGGPSDPANVTAVFDDVDIAPARNCDGVCYAHVGQHSDYRNAWFYRTRPAKPSEYADLLSELRSVYIDCRIVIAKRRTVRHGSI